MGAATRILQSGHEVLRKMLEFTDGCLLAREEVSFFLRLRERVFYRV